MINLYLPRPSVALLIPRRPPRVPLPPHRSRILLKVPRYFNKQDVKSYVHAVYRLTNVSVDLNY